MKLRKVLAVTLVAAMTMSMAACGGSNNTAGNGGTTDNNSAAADNSTDASVLSLIFCNASINSSGVFGSSVTPFSSNTFLLYTIPCVVAVEGTP